MNYNIRLKATDNITFTELENLSNIFIKALTLTYSEMMDGIGTSLSPNEVYIKIYFTEYNDDLYEYIVRMIGEFIRLGVDVIFSKD